MSTSSRSRRRSTICCSARARSWPSATRSSTRCSPSSRWPRGGCLCIVPEGHPLARRERVSADEIVAVPADRHRSQRSLWAHHGRHLLEHALAYEVTIRARFGSTVCALVTNGLGVAIIDEFTLAGGNWPRHPRHRDRGADRVPDLHRLPQGCDAIELLRALRRLAARPHGAPDRPASRRELQRPPGRRSGASSASSVRKK